MRTILLLLAAMLAVGPLATAAHCAGWTTSVTNASMTVSGPHGGANGYFVVVDTCGASCNVLKTTWVYQNTNGLGGLQRADPNRDDTCHGQITADTLVG